MKTINEIIQASGDRFEKEFVKENISLFLVPHINGKSKIYSIENVIYDVKLFLKQELISFAKEMIKSCEVEEKEKPFISNPESEAYMYSLAQFNKVVGFNSAIEVMRNNLEKFFDN